MYKCYKYVTPNCKKSIVLEKKITKNEKWSTVRKYDEINYYSKLN